MMQSQDSSKPKNELKKMEKEVAEAPKRNLTGSLDQAKEELRDAYMYFKEQQQRCILDITTVNKTDKMVYYFKPDTFLLDEPDKQRYFRESLIKKISAMPKPEPITYLGDDMHRIFLSTVADQSRPTICKKNVANFFKRRQYALQHLKYKILCRWAHLAMQSQQLDTGKDAVFLYGKVEYSIEQAMNRAERLVQEDYFDVAKPENRPHTKAELGEGSLYVENVDLEPQSLLREDDIEIFTRSVSYRNKVSKVINKFMSRLKWLPMQYRYEIFEDANESKFVQKESNIKQQFDFIDEIDERARKFHIVTPDFETELNQILGTHYARQHAFMYQSQSEKISNSWRSDHDNVPDLINNQHELKLRILEAAKNYQIFGDIELDHGYSFSYRVTVKFPQYFQRQCIKSQFSLYDVFAKESDKNQVQKHTLTNMTRVDTNIFRDFSTTPNLVPDDESLAYELRQEDIKVMRLKSCAYWIDYVCMMPIEPDWYRKQQAILNNTNQIDTLTQAGMNYLDVSDLASINRINEDNALLHQQTIQKLVNMNAHQMVISKTQSSANDGEKKLTINLQDYNNSGVEATQMDKHLMDAVQGGGVSTDMGRGRSDARKPENRNLPSRSGLRMTPQHLLVSYYTLRYMKSRDCKIKIMYALNFCRAVQKRLSLDLREFGTRERIDSHLSQPYVHSTDADKKVVTNVNLSKSPYNDISNSKTNKQLIEENKFEKMTVFDSKVINNMKNMASVRMYKVNGTFNNKVYSTCPAVPKFHCTFGEPTMRQTEDMEMDAKANQGGISKQSLKLMGRVDKFEIDETLEEVYVKDDFGVYILYDCVLQDMKGVEDELIKICSYYINKAEVLQDVHTEKPMPAKDRLECLSDILFYESSFQFKKVKLCMAHLECYEHIVDPLEQQRLMQVVTDIMARRPRLNLQANYFRDSYIAELDCLDRQLELVQLLIKTQIDLERKANKMLQDSLELSYTLCNQYEENRFMYQDAEELLQAVINRKKHETAARKYAEVMRAKDNRNNKSKNKGETPSKKDVEQVLEADVYAEASEDEDKNKNPNAQYDHRLSVDDIEVKTKGDEQESKSNDMEHSDSIDSNMSQMDLINNQENVFQQLLGLPEISIETLYLAAKEKDKTILHLMNEHTNFIQIHDGYPEFLNFQQGGTNGKQARNFKATPWSEPTANMDFYDSLGFINKFSSIINQICQELYDALKPYDPILMTYIETHVQKYALKEFRHVIQIMEGAENEYEGRQYVEDESVLGNPDKMVFYAKEMLSSLTMGAKSNLDPYLIAKMSVNTINFFSFPELAKSDNKYLLQFQDGIKPTDWVIKMHKQQLADSAKRKNINKSGNVNIDTVIAQTQQSLTSTRNVDVPSQLQTYCNMIELMRLRHEIILAVSECSVLEKVYLKQAEQCQIKGMDVHLPDGINFENVDIHDDQAERINFFDEGTSHTIQIGLAAREFDPCLLSNLNFRNPDTFKINITDAGLEEVRAVLMYQMLQKHLLIVATRMNQLLIDNSMKAISEINLLQNHQIATPNSTVDVSTLFSRNADNISGILIKESKRKFGQNLSNCVAPVFYNLFNIKRKLRTDIGKEYSNYMSKVSRVHMVKNACVQRVMRSFKVKQLVRYCETIILECHLDAQKVQAVQVCQSLRTFSQYFTFDPQQFQMSVIQKGKKPGEPRKEDYQVFKYETNRMIENFTYPYMPKEEEDNILDQDASAREILAISVNAMQILDTSAIPSSASLLQCESSSIEEMKAFKEKLTAIHLAYNKNYKEDLKQLDPSIDKPEWQTKEMLPAFTYRDTDPSQGKGKPEDSEIDKQGYPTQDYEESLNFSQSKFAKMMRFYQYMERIINLEWFICKLQFKQDTVVHMDNAIRLGLPFWSDTEYEKRQKKEIINRPIKEGVNPISQNFLHSNIVSRQSKKYIAEEISSMSLTIQNLLTQYNKTKDEQKFEYLNSYTEFRYMQILGSFHKIIQQFYIQNKTGGGIGSLKDAISQLAKMDHVRISYSKGNSYHVNTSLVHPHMQLLESTNLIHGAHSEDEYQNFMRCVQPVINEKALEPPQLTLFQSLYQTDSFRKRLPTQFAGQQVSSHNTWSFKSLGTALLDLSQEERTYAQSFIMQAKDQANDFMEIFLNDPSFATMSNDEVYSLFQLVDAKRFLSDTTQSLLLKNAIICWNENQVLPDSAQVYAKFEENFRNMFFWKIVEHKENMVQNLSQRGDHSGIPSKKLLEQLRSSIDDLQANYSLATTTEEDHRAKMIEKLKEEFRAQKKKVTLDAFYSTKAEIMVLSNEIEKLITYASVQALDSENTALSRCFTMSQPKIQFRIHPFQQFAATLYDKVDPQQHLDMVQKLGFVQEFLTKLGNRGTEVETLTSGPGVVFTKKDFNDAIQHFCRKVITYGEIELKNRSDLFFQKEDHYLSLIYVKDQKITDMERRIKNTAKNIENIISAKLFEKGNQLIYQLDSTSRLLILFKQTMYGLETEVRNKILGEQAQKFKLQKDALDTQIEKLDDYKNHVSQIVNEKFSQDYSDVLVTLKKQVEVVQNIDPETSSYIPPTLYPATGNHNYRNPVQQILIKHEYIGGSGGGGRPGNESIGGVIKDLTLENIGTLPGSVIPDGFRHYSHCICFQPDKKYPNFSVDLAQLEMYSEQEARFELARVCEVMRKQRLFWRTKEMLTKQKFQNKINLMKKQLSNNAYLWDQMAESEKRETILKQELLFTQQSLSAAEKVIEKLQEEMKKVEADRQRLYKYKHSKAERLKELEDKIKKFEVYENIDTDKLINVLGKKDKECKQLQGIADNFTTHLDQTEQKMSKEVGHYKGKLVQEQVKTQQIIEKMEQMKLELKMLESNDTSVASIWKKKCLDLFEVCQTLKSENEELRDRCKELIVQGIQLADAVNQESDHQNLMLSATHAQPTGPLSPLQFNISMQPALDNVGLPKLNSNRSMQKMNTRGPFKNPGTAGTSGRLGSSTANTYEYASNMGGYPVDESRHNNGPKSAMHKYPNPIDSAGSRRAHNMQSQFSISGQPEQQTADLQFASTAKTGNKMNPFPSTQGNGLGNLRSPQTTSNAATKLTSAMQGLKQSMNQRKSGGGPQTQQQQQRGKTVGVPSGPTYYMPGANAAPVTRPGQFTRQNKGRSNQNQVWSILGSAGGPKEQLAESSFNQSFHAASTDKFGSTNHSQKPVSSQQHVIHSSATRDAANKMQKTPQQLKMQAQKNRGVRQPNSALLNYAQQERHNDSLFESSKASANNTTNIARRQFNKAQQNRQSMAQNAIVNQNQRQTEMLGAAVFGSKMRRGSKAKNAADSQPISQTAMALHSTKLGSQVTDITSVQIQQTEQKFTTKAKQAFINTESYLGEASFAAAQMPLDDDMDGYSGGQQLPATAEQEEGKAGVGSGDHLQYDVSAEELGTQKSVEM